MDHINEVQYSQSISSRVIYVREESSGGSSLSTNDSSAITGRSTEGFKQTGGYPTEFRASQKRGGSLTPDRFYEAKHVTASMTVFPSSVENKENIADQPPLKKSKIALSNGALTSLPSPRRRKGLSLLQDADVEQRCIWDISEWPTPESLKRCRVTKQPVFRKLPCSIPAPNSVEEYFQEVRCMSSRLAPKFLKIPTSDTEGEFSVDNNAAATSDDELGLSAKFGKIETRNDRNCSNVSSYVINKDGFPSKLVINDEVKTGPRSASRDVYPTMFLGSTKTVSWPRQ